MLRKSSVSCLRQFAQKEAKAVFLIAAAENSYVAQGFINLNRQFGEKILKNSFNNSDYFGRVVNMCGCDDCT